MKRNILFCFLLFLFSINIIGCKSTNINKTKPKSDLANKCDMTLTKLAFSPESVEILWLQANQEQGSRINEFLIIYEYSDESIEYMQTFVRAKLQNNNYKLERFIELYALLQKNPSALIDGTLDKKKEN